MDGTLHVSPHGRARVEISLGWGQGIILTVAETEDGKTNEIEVRHRTHGADQSPVALFATGLRAGKPSGA